MYPIAEADIDPADLNDRVRTDSEPMTPIDNHDTSDGGEEAMMGSYEGVTPIEEGPASIDFDESPHGEAEPTWADGATFADGSRAFSKIHSIPGLYRQLTQPVSDSLCYEPSWDTGSRSSCSVFANTNQLLVASIAVEHPAVEQLPKETEHGGYGNCWYSPIHTATGERACEGMRVSSAEASSSAAPPAPPPEEHVVPGEDL